MTMTIKPTCTLFALSLVCASACDGVLPASCTGGAGTSAGEAGGDDGGLAVAHEQPCPDPGRSSPPVAELCPPARQIARVPGDCPVPGPGSNWTVESLFAGMTVPSTMEHYCRYLWTGPGAADLSTLPAAVQGQTSADCRVVPQSPMAPALAGPLGQAFAQGTQTIVDADGALGLGVPVDVAVVDTAPVQTSAGQSEHGPALAAVIAQLASGCAPGLDTRDCRRRALTYLGLPQTVGGGPDRAHGGYFGYQSDLAEGIVAAVDGWTNRDHKLIVNLSVGWEPAVGDLDRTGATQSSAIAAVRDAVALAHCQGAFVIAASGNQANGSCVDQPTAPGSWERLPGWDNKQCLGLGLTADLIELGAPSELHAHHPFLHAASPIDWAQQNLANFRPDSQARLAALGFNGFTELASSSHGPLSGSSVATAAVAGIAALVWSYYPNLSADELAQALHDGGAARTLGATLVTASVSPGSPPGPEQRVITACGSVAWACSNLAGPGSPTAAQCQDVASRCAAAYPSVGVDAGAWWAGFHAAYGQLGAADKQASAASSSTDYECERCAEPSISRLPRATPIPAEAMGDPWVLPQPTVPPCPMCVIDDDEIYLTLDQEYASFALDNVMVTLHDAAGGSESISYGGLPVIATRVLVVTDAGLRLVGRSGLPPQTAAVTMVFTDNSQSTGPVTIVASNPIPVR